MWYNILGKNLTPPDKEEISSNGKNIATAKGFLYSSPSYQEVAHAQVNFL